MCYVEIEIGSAKRYCLLPVLIAMILFFTGGCSLWEETEKTKKSEEKETAVSSLDGINNISCGGLSVTQNDTIYYVGEGEQGGEAIYAMDLSGENICMIYTPERYLNQLSRLQIYDQRLYFYEEVFNEDFGLDEALIKALDLDSSPEAAPEEIFSSPLELSTSYYYKGRLYFGEWNTENDWEDPNADHINRTMLMTVALDGGEPAFIVNYYEGFIICDDMIYYRTDKGLSRCDLEGKKKESLYKDDNGMMGLQAMDGKIYFVEYHNEAAPYLMSMDLDGGNPQRVIKDEISGEVYLVNARDRQLFLGLEEYVSPDLMKTRLLTIGLDGSGKGVVVSVDDGEIPGMDYGWCISGDWLFYAEYDDHNGRVLYKEPWGK